MNRNYSDYYNIKPANPLNQQYREKGYYEKNLTNGDKVVIVDFSLLQYYDSSIKLKFGSLEEDVRDREPMIVVKTNINHQVKSNIILDKWTILDVIIKHQKSGILFRTSKDFLLKID